MRESQSARKFSEKGYVPNWTEEVLIVKEVKNTVMWIYVIAELIVNTVSKNHKKMSTVLSEKKKFCIGKLINYL